MKTVWEILKAIAQRLTPTLIVNTTYTTGTANSWVKSSVTFTVSEAGLYRVRCPFTNTSVYGVARSGINDTSINTAVILEENSTSGTIDTVAWFPAGTWALWMKCGTASRINSVEVWRVL